MCKIIFPKKPSDLKRIGYVMAEYGWQAMLNFVFWHDHWYVTYINDIGEVKRLIRPMGFPPYREFN